jgi:hypothetical protein
VFPLLAPVFPLPAFAVLLPGVTFVAGGIAFGCVLGTPAPNSGLFSCVVGLSPLLFALLAGWVAGLAPPVAGGGKVPGAITVFLSGCVAVGSSPLAEAMRELAFGAGAPVFGSFAGGV